MPNPDKVSVILSGGNAGGHTIEIDADITELIVEGHRYEIRTSATDDSPALAVFVGPTA